MSRYIDLSGEAAVTGTYPVLMSSQSDLLNRSLPPPPSSSANSTNAAYSPAAISYFTTLNTYMHNQQSSSSLIFPDNGHIVTSNQMLASEWGSVVSIWPIDT